jgi:hypothetical protein
MADLLDEGGALLLDEAGAILLDEAGTQFPDLALDLRAELNVGGWTNVSHYLDHGPVTISRGHPDESATVAPSSLAVILTNGDGRFTSKNPTSPYYPNLVRNTPARISVPAQSNYLRMEGGDLASYASTPDSVSLELAGNFDIRADFWLSGIGGNGTVLAAKTSSSALSWALLLQDGGFPALYWTNDGTTLASVTCTSAIPLWGRIAVRASLNAPLGEVTFYTAATMAGSWTQLGATLSGTQHSPTSVYTGAVPLYAGGWAQPASLGFSQGSFTGRMFEVQLYNAGSTLVADPVFSSQTAGATSFADAQGNTWTLAGAAEISSRDYRCHAELAGWPQSQDPTGKTILANVSGGGLLRRKGRQSAPLKSAMTRYWTKAASGVAAYWPMEDGAGSSSFASGLGGLAMTVGGSPQYASNSDFTGSSALPALNFATLTGTVTGDSASELGASAVIFALEVPSGGDTNLSTVCTVSYDNQPDTVTLTYTTASSGTLTVTGYTAGTQIFTGTVATGVNGQKLAVQLTVQQTSIIGGTCAYAAYVLKPGSNTPSGTTGTYSGGTGQVKQVKFNDGGFLSGTVVGQCAVAGQAPVWSPVTTPLAALSSYLNPDGSYAGPLNAWKGEPAGIRFGRLCSEEGIQFRGLGSMTGTAQTGAQTLQTLAALLQECADADRGVWFEPRQVLGFGYLARSALYNQSAQVTVSYTSDHLSMWASDPVEDDQYTVNDVTVGQSVTSGSSVRAYAAAGQPVTGGRLSTAAPPSGAGTYDTQVSVNLYQDSLLASRATWEVHLGTVDEPRFPGIVLDLSNRDLASQFWAVLGLDLGQFTEIGNPPAWLPPDPVRQLAAQLTEVLWTRQLEITVCGIPERPYEVIALGPAHLDTDGTTLNAGVASGVTSMSFATAGAAPLWSTAGGDYPCDVMIAGERVTVTAVTGGSSPQTATVTRSINGVVKAQASGAAVTVYPSPVLAL